MPSLELADDAELVAATLAGDRRAFGRIVERYQRLLCSLAYSATGQLSQSEDLAQEAFVEGWRKLAQLRKPEKLRAWLCGILRFKISHFRRADGREPVRDADPLDAVESVTSDDQPTPELAIKNEEQALMWSALERIPETYREPLILFYREGRSVEHVAVALDLTEDAVKQRLARGRKILQEQVLSFVEGALARSTPGRVFTISVLAALPEMAAPSAKAIGLGAAAAHGGMLAKTTGLAALLASVSGVVSTVLALRANLDQSRTPRERRAVVKITLGFFFGSLVVLGGLYLLRVAAIRWWDHRVAFAVATQVVIAAFIVGWPLALMKTMHAMRALRSGERRRHPELFRGPEDQVGAPTGQYRSKVKFLGIPLVHVRFSSPDAGEPPVVGWFAGGDRAFGLIAAWGGLAVAPLSVGAVSVGVLSVGALGVGFVSLGTFALGALAIGSITIGVKAYAWLSALGWHTAQSGGFAIARLAAEGPIALAPHANDRIAHAFLADPHAQRNLMIFFILVSLLTLLPAAAYARGVRQRLGRRERRNSSSR